MKITAYVDAIRIPFTVPAPGGDIARFVHAFLIDGPEITVVDTGVAGAVAITLVGPFYWTWFAPVDWFWMALLCVTGTSSHYFLIKAYEYLDASEVQPLTYLQLVFASIIGVSVFGEVLSVNMIVGAVIVVGAGIFTVWRESVVARRAGVLQTHPPA